MERNLDELMFELTNYKSIKFDEIFKKNNQFVGA